MRLLVRIVSGLVAVVLLGAAGVAIADTARGDTTTFSAMFSSTVGLYPGSDVQILGVTVGKVTAVEPAGPKVRVRMSLDHGQAAAADTGAVIVAPTLVSDRFVQLTKPYASGRRLADGAVITHTAVPTEIDDLYRSLDSLSTTLGPEGVNKTGALSRFLTVTADNLRGNGSDINTTVNEFGKASGTLANSGDDLFATVDNLAKFTKTLKDHDASVAGVNDQLATVSGYLADDQKDMQGAVRNLAGAMADLQAFVHDNRNQLDTSVTKLEGPTQVLVSQKSALAQTLKLVPLTLQNFIAAYDPDANALIGRDNLNELSLWSKDGLSVKSSQDAPPTLLPGVSEGGEQ